MKICFKNQKVLVTGSSRGIGLETARRFAESGATVAIHYNNNEQAADAALKQLQGKGHIRIQGNLALPETAEQIINETAERIGGIDILVNNAGIFLESPPLNTDYRTWQQVWEQTIQVNLMAPANLMYCAIQQMKRSDGGKIINISSRGAFRGEPDAPAYGASKGGLNSLSQSMAKALAAEQVYIYTIAPGFVETDMATDFLAGEKGLEIKNQSPLGRVASVSDVARTVLFLASEGSEFLTGGIVDVNGASYLRQ